MAAFLHGKAQTFLTFSVNQPAQLSADAGADDIICPGDTVQLGGNPTANGGTANYQYNWTGSNILNAGDPNPMATPSATGDYILTITDANNCTALDTVSMTVDTCVGIADPRLQIGLLVYPNPNQGAFKVVVNGNSFGEQISIVILDMVGRKVEYRELGMLSGNLESDFSLPKLGKGTYLLRLQVGSEFYQRQIILQ